MIELEIQSLFDLSQTIATDLFQGVIYPWEVLPNIGSFIIKLGERLPSEEYDRIAENIWIAKSATVARSADIHGPCIIDKNAEIRHCAYLRGNIIVGEGAVIKFRCHTITM